jgi:AcrR family transcriptional regulator
MYWKRFHGHEWTWSSPHLSVYLLLQARRLIRFDQSSIKLNNYQFLSIVSHAMSSKTLPQIASPQRIKPVQARSRLKMDSILDAAARLIMEQGMEAASMLAIADMAAVPPATVYHYFENRLAVFSALAARTMESADAELTQLLGVFAASAELGSTVLLTTLYQAYRNDPAYVQVLRVLRAEPSLQELVRASNQRVADVLAGVLQQRTSLPSTRAVRIAWMLSESCEQILQAALVAEEKEAKALLAELIEMIDALIQHYLVQQQKG